MFEDRRCNMKKHTNKNNNNKMTDMGSVPNPKIMYL